MARLLTLPTELLTQIFSLVSSKSDLYHSLQTSKQLTEIIKPLLYHTITITDRLTRHLLENVNEEDSKRVKKLVIRGHDNLDPYSIGKDDQDDDEGPYDEDKVGQGCFRDLLEGKLLDLSYIEILHISNLREELEWIHWKPRPLAYKIASNLVELSVSSHTGTHALWNDFLQPERIPKLRRIGFCYVTKFHPRPVGGTDEASEREDYPRVSTVELPSCFPFEQIDVLAIHHSPKLPIPLSRTLLLVGPDDIDHLPHLFNTYPNVRLPDWYEHPLNLEEFQSSSIGKIEFLSLPSLHGQELSLEGKEWIREFEREGGRVRWDEEGSWVESSCVPRHFVDYLEGRKRSQAAEEMERR